MDRSDDTGIVRPDLCTACLREAVKECGSQEAAAAKYKTSRKTVSKRLKADREEWGGEQPHTCRKGQGGGGGAGSPKGTGGKPSGGILAEAEAVAKGEEDRGGALPSPPPEATQAEADEIVMPVAERARLKARALRRAAEMVESENDHIAAKGIAEVKGLLGGYADAEEETTAPATETDVLFERVMAKMDAEKAEEGADPSE